MILFLVGSLFVTPLLMFMGTGLKMGKEVYESRMGELYAADAGVEDAVWRIQNGTQVKPPVDCGDPTSWSYSISGVNGKTVAVNITYVNNTTNTVTYLVESTATGNGSGTKIDAYVTDTILSNNYSGILDNVITSQGDYILQGGQTQVDPPEGEEHGPVANYTGAWPTAEMLSDLYWQDVKDALPYYTSGTLDVKNYAAGIGPLYRDGTLNIINTGTAGLTVQLNGTVYITGDTLIGMTNKAFTLNLSGHTIFIESATIGGTGPGGPYALQIGTKCTLTGSGCIIAVGDIEFKPNLDCSPTDYVLVMSVEGQTYMQPNGDFYGTLAGKSEVYIQNGQVHWVDSSGIELNFPSLIEVGRLYSIASWEVNQQ